MKFVMMRNRTIASIHGHAVEFIKGELTHVPPAMYAEVMAAGAVPENELDEPEVDPNAVVEPTDPGERQASLFDAFHVMSLRGKREDFTAGGAPHAKALEKELGWKVDGKERDAAWVAFKTKED